MNRRASGTRRTRMVAPSSAAPADWQTVAAEGVRASIPLAAVRHSPRRAEREPTFSELRVLPWHTPARHASDVEARAIRQPRASTQGALALLEEPVVQLLAPPAQTEARPNATDDRILLALDDAGLASAVRGLLEAQSDPEWTVEIASNGVKALEFAAMNPPQLVLLDLALAHMDGAAVYHQLRADPLTERTPIIFTTAATSLDLYERGIQEGLLLRKPFDLGDLVHLVRELLHR